MDSHSRRRAPRKNPLPRSSSTMASRVNALCARWAAQAKSASPAGGAARTFSTKKSAPRQHDVGILAAEMYVPHRYVSQEKLEAYDKIPAGKYTVGA
jgi:hypothetical protein